MKKTKKFASKDYVAVVLYSVLAYIVMAAMGVAFSFLLPIAWPLVSGICLLPVSLIYLLMAYRIGKRGALFGFSLVLGLIYALMGIIIMLPYSIVLGIIGELILGSNPKNYRSFWRQALAYGIYAAGFGFGDMFTLYFLGRQFFEKMKYSDSLIDKFQSFATSPFWIGGNLLFTFALGIFGCWISEKILNKHFRKAGYLDDF
ncbi:MptD family putative ECF transporter S component [Liquorilactobacillus uvarum]|uniref:MptD family putative ECF transporter S component n=1 Tax=Liquorilactobacillus uvarum TaxID=303240 RepID=UPI0028895905|nr:MptD family putative ECF transporter S component [Liquorilactobacillus uvarum]